MAVTEIKLAGADPITGLDLLAVMFIGLKLTDNVDWNWGWVLAPVWGPLVLVVFIIAILKLRGK